MSASMSNITDYRIKSLPLSRRYWDCLHQKQIYDHTDEQTNKQTRNTVSNAHKMIPPRSTMFCMAKSLFYSGKPQNHSNKNLK